ncbi:nucleotide sugar dehydrogenase [Ectobacillus polymachus]|uniref:nucleotide sugar dehydrogenase n=1 Tax=Ectobacillus polymachus TaxID=1508806 RepID=UPI003A83A8D7
MSTSSSNKILVTGCAGFIGFHLANRLLKEGDLVIGLDNLNDYYDVSLKHERLSILKENENFTFIEASLEDDKAIKKIFSEHSMPIVVHLAAQAGVRYSLEKPEAYISSNIVGFMNILEACRHHHVEHLIYASSSSVYGSNTKMPFSVQDRVDNPISLYAATKKANELMAHTYSHLYNLKTTGLRFFTVYGPWGRPDMALFKFTKSILEGLEIDVYNHGEMKRDFTYIDDIIEGIYRLIKKDGAKTSLGEPVVPYKLYNIGNNQPVELMKFISVLEDKLGRKAKKNYLPIQAGDVPETYANIDDLMQDVGFRPNTPIDRGIEQFVQWYKSYYKISTNKRKVGVVGLGYVGLPVALAFGKIFPVVGFDINSKRIEELKMHIDRTGEVSSNELQTSYIEFTTNEKKLSECDFIIVTVPTPIDSKKNPDLTPLIKASETVGRNLSTGSIVVYESTVYPGATEEVCLPLLESNSHLKAGKDFTIGYSPERINPGDKNHTFKNIVKVVAGQDEKTLNRMAEMYSSVIDAKVYPVSSIKVAEASKVIENTQRDLNIALMNELALICNRLKIDTNEVLSAANTKWNFMPFKPGLVGGHCIGVDPYYLTYKAEKLGYSPDVILAGRKINDYMATFIATSLIKLMAEKRNPIKDSRVTVLGLTFKENVPDIRNSKVMDLIQQLKHFGLEVQLNDPFADSKEVEKEYDLHMTSWEELQKSDAVVLAVPHRQYIEKQWQDLIQLLHDQQGIFMDIKGVLDKNTCPKNIQLWRL